jgi:hypothetical protein
VLVALSGVLTGRPEGAGDCGEAAAVFPRGRPERAADCGEAARDARSGVLKGRKEGAGDCGEAAAVFPRERPEGAGDCGEAARDARSGVLTGRQVSGEAAAVFPRGRQEGAGDCGEAAAVSPRGRRGCAGDCGEVAQRVVFAPRLAGVCTGEACCRLFFKAASTCNAVSSGELTNVRSSWHCKRCNSLSRYETVDSWREASRCISSCRKGGGPPLNASRAGSL